MTLEEINSKLMEVFPLLPAPNYRLCDAISADYRTDKYSFEENWTTWKEIEDWQVAKCDGLFSFAPPEIAVYFLPRYTQYVINDILGTVDEKYYGHGDGSGDTLVWYLQEQQKVKYDNNLNNEQIDLIENFLGEIRNNKEYRETLDVGENRL